MCITYTIMCSITTDHLANNYNIIYLLSITFRAVVYAYRTVKKNDRRQRRPFPRREISITLYTYNIIITRGIWFSITISIEFRRRAQRNNNNNIIIIAACI